MNTNKIFPKSPVDTLWLDANVATMTSGAQPYGLLEGGAVAIQKGRIAWVGLSADLPSDYEQRCNNIQDCQRRLVTPGFIDCHTHIVYGGNRAKEFEMRLNGASYAEISQAGGGIVSTVTATRNASEDELYEQSAPRLEALMEAGVTTVEIKSGYGLNVDDELKMLRVARRLGRDYPIKVITTFLGAHALPAEFAGCSDDYIDLVCNEILPAVVAEKLADHVDAFCEGIAFSPEQVARVFDAAHHYNLPIKLHAEQLSDLKGAVLAASKGALSVDHLEYLAADDVAILAENKTAAVLLPGAFYYLRETQLPPVEALRKHKVAMALATDCNPGSSPIESLTLVMNMACTLFRLTPEEALAGVTCNGAVALGLDKETGTLDIGKRADMILWNVQEPAELSYRIGGNRIEQVLFKGNLRAF